MITPRVNITRLVSQYCLQLAMGQVKYLGFTYYVIMSHARIGRSELSRLTAMGDSDLTQESGGPVLKYALFCRDTTETDNGELTLNGIVDLLDLPEPEESSESESPVIATVDYNLAFCIGGADPGDHYLFVTLKTPGIPLETPPAQKVEWEEGILFQRWIKTFRIPVQKPGIHSAAILFDGIPLGEATFLVRFIDDAEPTESA